MPAGRTERGQDMLHAMCASRGAAAQATYQLCLSAAQEGVRCRAEQLRASRFRPGSQWVWLYRDSDGEPSSWERCSPGVRGKPPAF